jgi:hypothetical protein
MKAFILAVLLIALALGSGLVLSGSAQMVIGQLAAKLSVPSSSPASFETHHTSR